MSLVSKVGHFPLPLAFRVSENCQILIRKPRNPVTSCWEVAIVVRTPFRKVPKPLLGCKVRYFGGSKSVSIGIAACLPEAMTIAILLWGRWKQTVCLVGGFKFQSRGSIWFAAPGPGISILHQVAVDALAATGGLGWKWKAAKTRLEGQQKLAVFQVMWWRLFMDIIKSNKTTKHVWLSSFTWLKQQFLGGNCYLEDSNHLPNLFHHHVHSQVPRFPAPRPLARPLRWNPAIAWLLERSGRAHGMTAQVVRNHCHMTWLFRKTTVFFV